MKFWISRTQGSMIIDNAIINNIDFTSLPNNVEMIQWDGNDGAIEFNDAPAVRTPFTDPTPYLPFVDTWLTRAAALPVRPLNLAQAKLIKTGLIETVFDIKRQAPISMFGKSWDASDDSAMLELINTSALLAGVNATFGNMVADLNFKLSNLIGELNLRLANLIGELNLAFSNLIGELNPALSNLIGELNLAFSNLIGELNPALSSLIGELNPALSSLIGELNLAFSNLVGDINLRLTNRTSSTNAAFAGLIAEVNARIGSLNSVLAAFKGQVDGDLYTPLQANMARWNVFFANFSIVDGTFAHPGTSAWDPSAPLAQISSPPVGSVSLINGQGVPLETISAQAVSAQAVSAHAVSAQAVSAEAVSPEAVSPEAISIISIAPEVVTFANLSVYALGETSPTVLTLTTFSDIVAAIAARRSALQTVRVAKKIEVAALPTIPATIAYNVNAGWP